MLVLLTVVSKSFFLLVTVYLTGNLGSQTPLTVSQPRVMTGFPMLSFCHVGQCEQVHLSNNLSQPTTCLCEQLQRIIFSPGDETLRSLLLLSWSPLGPSFEQQRVSKSVPPPFAPL